MGTAPESHLSRMSALVHGLTCECGVPPPQLEYCREHGDEIAPLAPNLNRLSAILAHNHQQGVEEVGCGRGSGGTGLDIRLERLPGQ
jgi:hypothetical protein